MGLCEYCLLHQDDTPFTHPIDHIVAVKHGGKTVSENLALACIDCNRYKGSDLTAIDPETGTIVRLFDPRTQNWSEHFSLQDAQIVGATPTGRATLFLLRVNEPRRIQQRLLLISINRYLRSPSN